MEMREVVLTENGIKVVQRLPLLDEVVKLLNEFQSIDGSFDLYGLKGLTNLGKLERVSGSLDLRGTGVRDLGCLKKVGGYLYLSGLANLTNLGWLESVGRYLDLRGTGVEDLGELQRVGGDLYLDGLAKLTSLGGLESVGGDLHLSGLANLTTLGRLERVGGYLDLRGTGVRDLSELRSIGGCIYVDLNTAYMVPNHFEGSIFRNES
jgi:hypothetical protein